MAVFVIVFVMVIVIVDFLTRFPYRERFSLKKYEFVNYLYKKSIKFAAEIIGVKG